MTIWTIHRKGLPALHIFRWKIEQLYLQICGFIREDRYADPYGTKKRAFSLRLFRFAGHFSNRMVYHAGYSDVRKDPMQIILGLLIKIRACFLQMKRIGNISQRKFLWTILKRNARRTIILPVNIPGYCRNFGKPQSGLRQIWPTCTGMGQVSRLPMGTYRIWLATMCAVFRDDP